MKIKNFHTYDNFFKTIIQAHIIGLCMHYQGLTKINDLQIWFSRKDQPSMIVQIEEQYLDPEKVQNFHNKATINIFVDVVK